MRGVHPWSGVSERVRLGLITQWVTPELVGEVLSECRKRDRRPGALPAGFMVHFTLALALFHQDSYDDVTEQLVGEMKELRGCIPHKASFARARERLGPEVVERIFHRLAGPLAPAGLAGSFYRGMRLAAIDGFLLAVRIPTGSSPSRTRGLSVGYPPARAPLRPASVTSARAAPPPRQTCRRPWSRRA
ncbi:transposase domain-containing protein [Streptomyces sp. NPDC056831]|uniref:transposase domain-containing protein n=1 Tax=Streptomyces sp. NPDC056831 TaxID=3345954 RepID=UPI00368D6FE9